MKSTGNAKGNEYWESELPQHFERSSSDTFIRAKYSEKRWVSPGAIQPAPIVSQLSCKVSHLVESGYKPETPKKARTLSLDEEILLHHVLQVTPPETRTRAGSVDMKENVYVVPLPEFKKPNQKNENFSSEVNQNRRTTIAPPSSWATFD
jgi:stromal membrane-associated protein